MALDLHGGDGACDRGECGIAIVHQVRRAFVIGKGVAELLRRPRRSRVIGDRDMHDASSFVGEDHQHEQQAIVTVGTTSSRLRCILVQDGVR
jgi:hypothetical protein